MYTKEKKWSSENRNEKKKKRQAIQTKRNNEINKRR